MQNDAKLKSLQELRAMLDSQMLGKLSKPGAAPAELPSEEGAIAPEEGISAAAPEGEALDPESLQALLAAYGKDDEAAPVG